MRIASFAAVVILGIFGCRTKGVPARIFSTPLTAERLAISDLVPNLANNARANREKFVHHWTTGSSAVPPGHAPPLSKVLLLERSCSSDDLAAMPSPIFSKSDNSNDDAKAIELAGPEALSPSADLTLCNVFLAALSNNQVLRRDADFVVSSSQLVSSPQQVTTTLSPSIQKSGYLFGQRGEAAALSDFDSQFSWTSVWGRNESIQNNLFLSGGILPGGTLLEDTADATMEISRNTRLGGQTRLFHTIAYDASNRQDLLFPSAYRTTLGAEIRQPFLAGAGRTYTDIAGPPGEQISGVSGVRQGVLIARNQSRIAGLALQTVASQLLSDVESAYFDLRAAFEASEAAEQTCGELAFYSQAISARIDATANAGELDRLAIEDVVLRGKQLAQTNKIQRENATARLARLLSLTPESIGGSVPVDGFSDAKLIADKFLLADVALTRRPEIRQQTLRIRELDLQIRAAQSLLLPQLDGIARYQLNGFGDKLSTETVAGPDEFIQSSYNNLFQNDHTGWQLGFQFTHQFGRRLERTRLRNLRLQAQQERVVLEEQKQDIRREVSALAANLNAFDTTLALTRNRLKGAQRRKMLLRERYEAEDGQTDLLQLAEAELEIAIIKTQLINERTRYRNLQIRMRQAVGRTLDESQVIVSDVGVPESHTTITNETIVQNRK